MSLAPAATRSRTFAIAFALAVLSAPASSFAAGARVHLQVIIALASNKGAGVDKRLEKMARDFKSQNLAFTNFQVVGGPQSVELSEGQSSAVSLPGAGKADVTFVALERDGRAKVRVSVPGAPGDYLIPSGGEVIVHAGARPNGSLFVSIRR